MKRVLDRLSQLAIILTLLFAIAGCNESDPDNESNNNTNVDGGDGNEEETMENPLLQMIFSASDLAEIRRNVSSGDWREDMYEILIKDADDMLLLSTDPYVDTKEDETSWSGTAGRRLGTRVISLAFAGYVTKDEKYIDQSRELLLAAIRASEPDDTTYWSTHLQIGDAAQAICLGYDLLYPYMSASERTEVYTEIAAFGEYLYSGNTYSADDASSMSSNHNSVHYGALGLCALVTSNTTWLNKAISQIEGFYENCADETGYVTESHHYMSYGMAGAVPFSIALKRLKGRDMITEYKSLFEQFGDQITWAILPNNVMTSLNDVHAVPAGDMATMGAVLYDQPEQLWSWLESNKTPDEDQIYMSAYETISYTRCYLFLPMAEYVTPLSPSDMGTPLLKEFESGRVFARSGWGSTYDAHISFTSGYDHHHGHNHPDENSITFYALGDVIITDPGYKPIWNYCHTSLKIDGEDQWVEKGTGSNTVGVIESVREDSDGVFVRGEAKGAYDNKGIDSSLRKFYFMHNASNVPYVIWRDDVAMESNRAVDIVTRIIASVDSTITDNGDDVTITAVNGTMARVVAYSGATNVDLGEDDLSGEYGVYSGSDVYSEDYFKRVSGYVANTTNPRLTTLVLPYRTSNQLPAVEVRESGDDIIYTLTYTNSKVHTITLSADDITVVVN